MGIVVSPNPAVLCLNYPGTLDDVSYGEFLFLYKFFVKKKELLIVCSSIIGSNAS